MYTHYLYKIKGKKIIIKLLWQHYEYGGTMTKLSLREITEVN